MGYYFNPAHPGTQIVPDDAVYRGSLRAVTVMPAQPLIALETAEPLNIGAVAARISRAVAGLGVGLTRPVPRSPGHVFVVPGASGSASGERGVWPGFGSGHR
jgi:hypothetical protein